MNILLLSAYNTHSHNYWCNLLINNITNVNWTFLTLPPRKFSWRIRGNALSWMGENHNDLIKNYDTVLATSMVDLASLIGLYPNLGSCKKIIYFHENQFEYPLSDKNKYKNIEAMMVNLYGALAADTVIFNSNYNMTSFFKGAKELLKRINDHSPLSLVDGIKDKSVLLPVPICQKQKLQSVKIKNSIIWNHRWEYDKNPEDFYTALKILKERNINFKLIIMGIEYKNSPETFSKIKSEFSENLLCYGFQDTSDYTKWLSKGEIVISTAIHEFQGLAVMEAVQYGAIPIVPNRLSYPEWFPSEYLYEKSAEDLADLIEIKFKTNNNPPMINGLTTEKLIPLYKKIIMK